MDLNYLYSQHQLSLMRAACATSRLARTKYLATAGLFANRISNHQLARDATASAAAWLRKSENPERPAAKAPGLVR